MAPTAAADQMDAGSSKIAADKSMIDVDTVYWYVYFSVLCLSESSL